MAGPKMWGILEDFWARKAVVARKMANMAPSSGRIVIFLMENVSMYKIMMCHLGAIRLVISEEVVGRRIMGKGATYWEILQRCPPCPDCGVDLTAGSMTAHQRRLHGTEPAIDWDWLPVTHTYHLPQVFEVRFPRVTTKCQLPFPGCSGFFCTWRGLRNHFNRQHWRYSLLILEEHPSYFPHCEQCGRQMPPWLINNWNYT